MSLPDSFDEFCLLEDTGFTLELPESLPPEFAPWHEIAKQAYDLLYTEGGAKTLNEAVRKMPVLNSQALTADGDLKLAHLQLAYLTAVYVLGDRQNKAKPQSIPECLAVPLCDVANRLGILPILNYTDLVTNWRRLDRNGPFTRENLEVKYKFLGGQNAEEFVLLQFEVELCAVTLIPIIRSVLEGSKLKDEAKVVEALNNAYKWIQDFMVVMKGYHARVDPINFFADALYLFRGFNEKSGFPEGIVYEGVSDEPRIVPPSAASESCIFQVLECLMRVEHSTEPSRSYFKNVRENLWLNSHRKFYKFLEDWPGNVRDMAMTSSSTELKESYNRVLDGIKQFRTLHIILVTRFVTIPLRKDKSEGDKSKDISDLMTLLKGLRESGNSQTI